MMDFEGFADLALKIESLGYDSETANEFASLIGDLHTLDESGEFLLVIDRENNAVLAKLPYKALFPEDD
jgi:hypothetical protein